jgi:hypothetical protein
VLFVSSAVDLAPLKEAIDKAAPPVLDGKDSARIGMLGELGATWHLTRKPIAVAAVDGAIEVKIAAAGEVTLSRGNFHCTSKDAGVELVARARPRLDGKGDLAFTDSKVESRPLGTLSCSGVPVPLDLVLAPAFDLAGRGLSAAMSQMIVPLGPLVRAALDELAAPRPISIAGAPACLDLAPRELVLAPLGGSGDRLALRAGADVAPRISLGKCPPATPAHWDEVVVREEKLTPRFKVAVAAAVSGAEMEQRLGAALIGHHLGDGGDLTVDKVTVGDANGRILLKLDVSGTVRGSLYLWGTPEIREEAGRIVLDAPDLQAALETRTLLDRLKVAVWTARGGDLVAAAKKAVRTDLTERLAEARGALTGRWIRNGNDWVRSDEKKHLALNLRLDRITPGAVSSRPGALLAAAVIEGEASIDLP